MLADLSVFPLMQYEAAIGEDNLTLADENGYYHAAVYLIAQIGKNFAIPEERRINGHDLLDLAIEKFETVKNILGGKLVMVEREADRPKLLEFYKANGFKSWTTRCNAKDGVVYDQMFASL